MLGASPSLPPSPQLQRPLSGPLGGGVQLRGGATATADGALLSDGAGRAHRISSSSSSMGEPGSTCLALSTLPSVLEVWPAPLLFPPTSRGETDRLAPVRFCPRAAAGGVCGLVGRVIGFTVPVPVVLGARWALGCEGMLPPKPGDAGMPDGALLLPKAGDAGMPDGACTGKLFGLRCCKSAAFARAAFVRGAFAMGDASLLLGFVMEDFFAAGTGLFLTFALSAECNLAFHFALFLDASSSISCKRLSRSAWDCK